MPLSIHLNGDEAPEHVSRLMQALIAYATGNPLQAPATTGAAETTSGKGGRGKGKPQPADTTASDPAADAATDAAAEAAAATAKAAESAKSSEPEVTVEEIRAVAAEFNTDETRQHAIAILTSFNLQSVSAAAKLEAEKRKELIDALRAKLASLQQAAALA